MTSKNRSYGFTSSESSLKPSSSVFINVCLSAQVLPKYLIKVFVDCLKAEVFFLAW